MIGPSHEIMLLILSIPLLLVVTDLTDLEDGDWDCLLYEGEVGPAVLAVVLSEHQRGPALPHLKIFQDFSRKYFIEPPCLTMAGREASQLE